MLTPETYPNVLTAAQAIVKHAEAHYEEGWDVIVECYTPETLTEHLMYAGVTTAEEAWASAKLMVDHYLEQCADAVNSAF